MSSGRGRCSSEHTLTGASSCDRRVTYDTISRVRRETFRYQRCDRDAAFSPARRVTPGIDKGAEGDGMAQAERQKSAASYRRVCCQAKVFVRQEKERTVQPRCSLPLPLREEIEVWFCRRERATSVSERRVLSRGELLARCRRRFRQISFGFPALACSAPRRPLRFAKQICSPSSFFNVRDTEMLFVARTKVAPEEGQPLKADASRAAPASPRHTLRATVCRLYTG